MAPDVPLQAREGPPRVAILAGVVVILLCFILFVPLLKCVTCEQTVKSMNVPVDPGMPLAAVSDQQMEVRCPACGHRAAEQKRLTVLQYFLRRSAN